MAKNPITDIEASLRGMARDPFRFTELVDKWNAMFDEDEARHPKPNALDAVADQTLQAIASESTADVVSPHFRQMINALPHVAFVVRHDGLITAMNNAALAQMEFDPGDCVGGIGYALECGEDLKDLIARLLDRRNAKSEVVMIRAVHNKRDRAATLAIIPSTDGSVLRALVFVIDPVWREDVRALVRRAYDLTTAELDILMAFLDGNSLRDIADLRRRSLTTVRTQFQTIMNKAGSRGQAELMRNTIAVSQFFSDIDGLAEASRHPFRRRYDIMRDGGRSVDVTLVGKITGPLVISIPDATQFLFPAHVEQALKQAGLCVAFMCRPGTGRTDPAPCGQDYLVCLAEDVTALLDQLGRDTAVLLSNNMSSTFAYGLGAIAGKCLTRIIVTSTLVPAPLLDGSQTRSPWAKALMRAVQNSPSMYRIMVHSAIKAWKVMGSRRMYLMQLKGFQPDVEAGQHPDAVAAYHHAMETVLSQGPEHAVIAFEYASRDWTEWIENCDVPIELVQGRSDPSSSFEAVQAFAAQHPDKITLSEVPNAGYLTFLTHTDRMIGTLKAAVFHG